jgi:transcriptional regulator with XRE-family HTH domain
VVADARRKAGLSQAQLAAMLGKAKSHVALIERGQRRIDTLELYRMAQCFGLPSEALFLRISRALDRRAAQPSPAAARLPGA